MKMMNNNFVIKAGNKITIQFLKVLFLVFILYKNTFAQAPTAFIVPISPQVLCETQEGQISFNILGGTPTYTLYYTLNGNPKQITTNTTNVTISQFGTPGQQSPWAFALTGITDQNYSAIQPISNQTFTLEFYPKPVASIAVSGNTLQICPDGGSYTIDSLTDGVTAANGNIVWSADNGFGNIVNGNSKSPTYTAVLDDAGNNNLRLRMKVESDNICGSVPEPGSKFAEDTYFIRVRPAITTSQDFLGTVGKPFCQFDPSAQILYTASGGTSPYKFYYYSSLTGNTDSVLTTPNNTNALIGGLTQTTGVHSFYLESVKDVNCLQTSLKPNITFTVTALPQVSFTGNPKACKGEPEINFKLKVDFAENPAPYTFNYTVDGSLAVKSILSRTDSIVISTNEPGVKTYSLTSATDALGCEAKINNSKAVVTINQRPNARFAINKNRTSILEPEITITDLSIATDIWFWDFGDSSSLYIGPNPGSYTYKDTGTYNITLIAANNACGDTTSLPVRIFMPYSMYVPSAFTPNGDGLNDKFAPEGEGFLNFDMSIFDRWGNRIYYTTDIKQGWDGKANGGDLVSMNSCVYVINIVALDKKTYSYSGTITIPR